MYFNNKLVEGLVIRYQDSGCIDVELRDEIMSHVPKMAEQIIRRYRLWTLFGEKNWSEESMQNLVHIAWVRVEKILYKFDRNAKTKLFSQWTSVIILTLRAAAKTWNRDNHYKAALGERIMQDAVTTSTPNLLWDKFCEELLDVRPSPSFRKTHPIIVEAILGLTDEERQCQFIQRTLINKTGLPRNQIKSWMTWLQSCQSRFTITEREPETLQLPMIDRGSETE